MMHIFILAALALGTKQIWAGVVSRGISLPFTDLVVFGDSYSDNGNAYRFTNDTWPADPAYYKGRFSNGPVWVEDVAQKLDLRLRDFAIGGSTSANRLVQGYTGPNSTIAVPSALDQLSQYLSDVKGEANIGDTLFATIIGANDALFDANVTAAQSADNIVQIIRRLRDKGAKHFLVASYPDISRLPYGAYTSAAIQAQLHTYSLQLRSELKSLAGPSIAFVDFYSLFNDLFAHPDRYGYDATKITKSCLTGAYGEAPRTLCNDPDRYIFWDEYHPTKKTHRLVADVADKAIRETFH